MMTSRICCSVLLAAAWAVPVSAADAVLSRGGRTDWSIAVAPDASPTDVFAAEELQLHLRLSTGAEFPIVSNAVPKGPAIEVGTAKARELVGADRARALKDEESVYVQKGGRLAIVGGGRTGNAYGVYSFLERELGCRWFDAAGGQRVPRHPDLTIGPRDVTERPALRVRKIACIGDPRRRDSSEHLFWFRNRLNCISGHYENVFRKDLKGKLVPAVRECGVTVHSLFSYVSPKDHFKDHPDWFTFCAKRNRRVDDRQLCFSNPGLRKTLIDTFLARVARYCGQGVWDLSAMDVGGAFCECEDCRKLVERYGVPGGPFFDCLIELSSALAAKYPDARVKFLVYRDDQTRFPPSKGVTRFPDNVIAIFAPISADLSKDYLSENNKPMFEDLKRWTAAAEVWQWYYPQLYGPLGRAFRPPYGGFARTALDTRLSYEAGMVGGCYEHDVDRKCGVNFFEPLMWMILRLYIDPTADWKALRKDCFDFFYGAAADDLIAFEDYLEAKREKAPWQRWNGSVDDYLSPAKCVKLNAFFERAERKAGTDPEIRQRIREVRAGVDYELLRRHLLLAGSVPSLGWTVEDVRNRLTDTVTKAVARRYDIPDSYQEKVRKGILDGVLKDIDEQFELQKMELKPLPGELANLKPSDVIQVFPPVTGGNGKVRRVDMADAAIGKALVEDVPEDRLKIPYSVGLYDHNARKTLVGGSTFLKQEQIVPDAFHLYRLGRTDIPSSRCGLWVGWSWNLGVDASLAFVAGERPEYDVYVSLKFEGPRFGGDASRKSAVYFDRLIFVKVGDAAARP